MHRGFFLLKLQTTNQIPNVGDFRFWVFFCKSASFNTIISTVETIVNSKYSLWFEMKETSKSWFTLWQISWKKQVSSIIKAKGKNDIRVGFIREWNHCSLCADSHFYVYKSTFFLNKIFLLEKKAVIYEKTLDSWMVFSVWILSVLPFHPSQKGPAGPAASSEWEEKQLGWCLPAAVCAWVAEAARSEVQVQLGPHGETPSQK